MVYIERMVINMVIRDVDAKGIWEAYKMFSGTAYIVRTGFQCFGMTQDYSTKRLEGIAAKFYERGQSSLEHQANVSLLCNLFSSNFPGFFGQKTLTAQDFQHIWALSTVALVHDAGETEVGDIPDDGRLAHATKKDKEREAFLRFVETGFSPSDARVIMDGYDYFSEPSKYTYNVFSENIDYQYMFNALYGLDKADAVYTLIFCEKNGLTGNMRHKTDCTPLDKKTMEVTGTTNPVDCLALHLKMIFESLNLPDGITEPIYAVLRVAIIDTRGKFFDWWDCKTPDLKKYTSSPR